MKKLYLVTFDSNGENHHVGGIQKRIEAKDLNEAMQFFSELGYDNIRAQLINNPTHDYLEVLRVDDKRFPMGKYKDYEQQTINQQDIGSIKSLGL
jgi:hypothetical protein